MSNTLIQIKRSTTTAIPPNGSLAAGEQAYSYSSNTLFIGTPNGLGVIAVGGKYYIDTTIAAFAHANAAFDAANNALLQGATYAFGTANLAYAQANQAFATANASYNFANSAHSVANLAFTHANGAFAAANAGLVTANAAFAHANAAYATANAAFASANAGQLTANAAFVQANAAAEIANTKLALAGGTITGNLSVVGSLVVSGNTYVIDGETLRVSDPLIYLAGNNYVSDIVDIGFIANYVNATGSNVHTGLYREHEDKEYYLFQGYDKEPANNHIGAFSNNMTLAVLNADLRTSNLILGGANAILTIGASFNHANAAHLSANAALVSANAGLASANAALATGNAAFEQANTARIHANVGFEQANTARTHANAAFASANAGQSTANASYAFANSAHAIANIAFDQANTAYAQANAASVQASNADFLSIGTVAPGRISGSYPDITGVGTLTTGTWQASNVAVAYGGTGQTSFTTNGVLFGNGSGALNVTSAGTEGQVLQASSSGTPQFAMLDGGTF
jgi:hypothetical protein